MKRFLLLAAAFVMSAVAMNAQDLLTKNNGEDIEVIVKEIDVHNVKYVLFGEPDGVLYSMPKSEILIIRYASGRNEVFSQESARRKAAYPFAFDYGGGESIYHGMKYAELKNIYDHRDWHGGYRLYSPAWCGIGSFFIPGLGQMCCGEVGRGAGQLGLHVCFLLLTNACLPGNGIGSLGAFYVTAVGAFAFDIWSVVDAVRVARVKNMYETDLRSMRSSVEIEMYPSLNTFTTQSNGVGVAPGMTLSFTF